MTPEEGRVRVVITGVQPEIEGGLFPIKRTLGDKVIVEGNIFTDGHDALAAWLLYRHEQDTQWRQMTMQPVGNDRWRGSFAVTILGPYRYTLRAQIDRFSSWLHQLVKKI